MTCFKRDLENQGCCNNWQNGIRTIDGQYPDDNREFKIIEGAGILITPVTAGIKITNATDPGALEAGQNIELTPNNDKLTIATTDDISIPGDLNVTGETTLNGDLNVNGNIYNQGASYESHMEQVYTNDDYIIMRDGAVAALGTGQYAGFQVKKYDGTNDGRLVIDNTGTARVGDVGDEQPLLTREESADLSNGEILTWDAANSKAVGISNNFVQGTGNIGTDTKPIKIVNGVATAITNDLIVSGNSNSYKWILKSGYVTMRFQTGVVHSVVVNFGVTVADPNSLFPMVTLAYNGVSWGDIALNVSDRTTSGFTINSWIPSGSADITGDVFWMVMIPVSL